MSKFFSNRISVCNMICAVLMVILLVLQFCPFWQFGENQESSASIQGYIWFPTEHGDLETYFEEATGSDYSINSILIPPILTLVLGAAGIVLCLIKSNQIWASIFPIACGAVGIWGYLGKAVFKLGVNWQMHLVICIAMLVVGVVGCYMGYKDMKNI